MGKISAQRAQELFRLLVIAKYADAFKLGSELAEAIVGEGWAQNHGMFKAMEEMSYFRGFLGALYDKDTRYFHEDGTLKTSNVGRRVEMYLPKLEGSANWGWLQSHPIRTQFEWVLGAADHCKDCIIYSEGNPYYRETLSTVPRAGDTICHGNCKCELRTLAGARSFSPAEYRLVESLGLAA